MKKKNINYGQELILFLWILSILIIVLLSIMVYLWISGHTNSGMFILLGSISVLFGIFIVTSIWSSRIGKLIMRDNVIRELKILGNENVLDIGCGKGLLTVGIAKKLSTGKVTGLDHWKSTPEYNYTIEMAQNNINCEGVKERVELVTGDAQKLPFEPDKFDVITSSLVMHHVNDSALAFREMMRGLKPAGIIAIADMPIPAIKQEIINAGFEIVMIKSVARLFFVKVRLIIAKKN